MPATKEDIARKFMELAFRHGYKRTSVEDVARALRISKKTVYDFFASKEDLLRCALELSAREQRAHVELMLTGPTPLGRIEEVVRIALADARRYYEGSPHADLREPSELSAEVNALVFEPLVRDLIASGVEAGELDVPDLDFAASFAMAVGNDAVRLIAEDPSRHPEDATLAAIRRMLVRREVSR